MARKPRGSIVTRFFVKVQHTDEEGRQHETTLRAKSKARAQQLKREALKRWPKAKTSIDEHLYARVRYTMAGRPREYMRRVKPEDDAEDIITSLLADLQPERQDQLARQEKKIEELITVIAELRNPTAEKEQKKFSEVAKHYEQTELIPAEIRDGHQFAGIRSVKPALSTIKPLKEYFGDRLLRGITYSDLDKYKKERLRTPTRGDIARHERQFGKDSGSEIPSTRTYAAVHRELAKLRRMIKLAIENEWLDHNPFTRGKPLIQSKLEKKRKRVLSRDEEVRLLAACTDRRAHLRPIVIAAVDTGCRRGELLKLRWRNVDFESNAIFIAGGTTKMLEARPLQMTIRLREELARLHEESPGADFLVFGIQDNFTSSWESARRVAQLEDKDDPDKNLHFHDLRATCITRWLLAGIPLAVVQKLAGHKDGSKVTYQHYFTVGVESAQEAAAALDRFNAQQNETAPTVESDVIN